MVAESIADFSRSHHNREVISHLRAAGVHWPEAGRSGPPRGRLAGYTFVLTGTLPHLRAKMRSPIEAAGR